MIIMIFCNFTQIIAIFIWINQIRGQQNIERNVRQVQAKTMSGDNIAFTIKHR